MPRTHLHIERFVLGDWQTNCYLVHSAKACWIVDAGFAPGRMIQRVKELKLTPCALVLTHAHLDHIAGIFAVRAAWPDLPILLHQAEHAFLGDPMLNLSIVLEEAIVTPNATGTLAHGQTLHLDDDHAFQVRHTPGHSPGGVCLYQPQHRVALVGDTLFQGSIGRYDFPTSDGPALLRSIREQLLTLPDDTRVLPGHGDETTIAAERDHNPYLRAG